MRQPTTERVSTPPSPVETTPTRRDSARTLIRAALMLVAVGTNLMLVAVGTNAGFLIRDQHRFPPPGELVQLSDGRNLHLDISGASNGGATVILDSGHGAFSPAMRNLQRSLSEDVRVVAYDRPGYGWSDPVTDDRAPLDVNDDLREALAKASIDGPFIVVGHSLGGLYARGFAGSHPDEVAGIVLIDPAHEHQLDRLPDDIAAQMSPPTWLDWPMRAAAHVGVLRVLKPGAGTTAGLPPDAVDQLQAFTVTPRYSRTYLAEARDFERLASSVPPPAAQHPTIVLNTPVPMPGFEPARPAMNAMNRELADRFPNVSFIDLAGVDHTSVVTDSTHAEQVAAVVRALYRSIAD